MIAVTFALPEESQDFRRKLREVEDLEPTKAGPVLTGLLHNMTVVLFHTGVGMEAAAEAGESLFRRFQPSVVISSGFAGALAKELRVGDVVFDAREHARFSGLDALVPRCFAGKLVSRSQAAETLADKAALHRETGAMAVDMETAAIASACDRAKVPLVSIRGISDAAGEPLPVPMAHWFDMELQRPRPWSLLRFLARNPGKLGGFVKFVRGLPRAREAMTHALLIFIEENLRTESK